MVRAGGARDLDRLGNNGADEAADFGRRRMPWWIIDARRYHSGVCARWRPLVLGLHRFFIAIARAVVNHDGVAGTALDPVVWSVGGVPKRRRVVHAVRDRAFLPAGIWDGERSVVAATPITCHDIESGHILLACMAILQVYWCVISCSCGLPRRFVSCVFGANHCRLRPWVGEVWSWPYIQAS